MTPVFCVHNIPERNLHAKATCALHDHEQGVGRDIRHNLARQLVEKILDSEHFFEISTQKIHGVEFLSYRADVIVMTREEYARMLQEQFTAGAKHASGFIAASMQK